MKPAITVELLLIDRIATYAAYEESEVQQIREPQLLRGVMFQQNKNIM
jgi:hypothetical protein